MVYGILISLKRESIRAYVVVAITCTQCENERTKVDVLSVFASVCLCDCVYVPVLVCGGLGYMQRLPL